MLDNISAREIAVSGLRASRTRMNVIANNIANAETTRTPEGGPFRRQMAILMADQLTRGANPDKMGVRVKEIKSDTSAFRSVFEPAHPDANQDGYVSFPNINLAVEMVDLLSAQRLYEANVAVLAAGGRMRQSAMDLLQR